MDELIGKKVTAIRPMTDDEQNNEHWHRKATVIEFDDGTRIYASRDDEGNGPGAMFGVDSDGKQISIYAE